MRYVIKNLWEKWLKFAELVGNFNARLVLSILYFLIFIIPSLFLTFIYDKVGKKLNKKSYYVTEHITLESLKEAKEM
jgi:hypothetical protein